MLEFNGIDQGPVRNFELRFLLSCCNRAVFLGIEQAGINETQYSHDSYSLPVTCAGITSLEAIF